MGVEHLEVGQGIQLGTALAGSVGQVHDERLKFLRLLFGKIVEILYLGQVQQPRGRGTRPRPGWAFETMRLSWAWRKIVVRLIVGTRGTG